MDSSRRAVESYWRSRMIDAATSDEDKVTPVYKLEEICDLLRSSHASIVREVSEFVLKRLDHKNPIVKQKVRGLESIDLDVSELANSVVLEVLILGYLFPFRLQT